MGNLGGNQYLHRLMEEKLHHFGDPLYTPFFNIGRIGQYLHRATEISAHPDNIESGGLRGGLLLQSSLPSGATFFPSTARHIHCSIVCNNVLFAELQ